MRATPPPTLPSLSAARPHDISLHGLEPPIFVPAAARWFARLSLPGSPSPARRTSSRRMYAECVIREALGNTRWGCSRSLYYWFRSSPPGWDVWLDPSDLSCWYSLIGYPCRILLSWFGKVAPHARVRDLIIESRVPRTVEPLPKSELLKTLPDYQYQHEAE